MVPNGIDYQKKKNAAAITRSITASFFVIWFVRRASRDKDFLHNFYLNFHKHSSSFISPGTLSCSTDVLLVHF